MAMPPVLRFLQNLIKIHCNYQFSTARPPPGLSQGGECLLFLNHHKGNAVVIFMTEADMRLLYVLLIKKNPEVASGTY